MRNISVYARDSRSSLRLPVRPRSKRSRELTLSHEAFQELKLPPLQYRQPYLVAFCGNAKFSSWTAVCCAGWISPSRFDLRNPLRNSGIVTLRQANHIRVQSQTKLPVSA
nr:hypothetical protein Iba_scaffold29473CG0020 [Ipomoea batatas]GMD41917.1 hypothetical protein Iba_chr10bCG4310 [Ipomoea batatas]GME08730.1 hypothetical protein Iba_scaffold8000.4CG0070 [Ipomoea batatas]GME21188.1 hypothetical protein Iba_scaffold27117CG0010 [Ipomoea batatas]